MRLSGRRDRLACLALTQSAVQITFVGERRITVANSASDGASDEHDTRY